MNAKCAGSSGSLCLTAFGAQKVDERCEHRTTDHVPKWPNETRRTRGRRKMGRREGERREKRKEGRKDGWIDGRKKKEEGKRIEEKADEQVSHRM